MTWAVVVGFLVLFQLWAVIDSGRFPHSVWIHTGWERTSFRLFLVAGCVLPIFFPASVFYVLRLRPRLRRVAAGATMPGPPRNVGRPAT